MTSQAADLIASGVEVFAEDDEYSGRQFTELAALVANPGCYDSGAGVREVVAMLRDAADSAIDVHSPNGVDAETLRRMSRFSGFLSQALQELR
jgi:hypothetical protein